MKKSCIDLNKFVCCHLVLGAFLTGSASAAISITQSVSGLFDPGPAGEFSIPFDVINPGSVVVAGFNFDGGNGRATSLSFGSGVGDQTATVLLSELRTSLAYFASPATDSSLFINGVSGNTAISNAGYFIWELAGVDLTAPVASVIGTSDATQITTTVSNSLIIDVVAFNPFGASIVVVPDSTNSILTKFADLDVNSGVGGGWLTSGTATPVIPGVQELGWNASTAGGLGDLREMAFAFAPVPEPSGSALLVGSLGLLALRRRRSA